MIGSTSASISTNNSVVPTTLQANENDEEFGPQMINKLEV